MKIDECRNLIEGIADLRTWQRERLKFLRKTDFLPSKYINKVTLVVYSFPHKGTESAFDLVECAIRQSWCALGMLKTTIVVNRHFPEVDAFACKFGSWIDVQVENTLIPGDIASMSADCNGRLFSRFATQYCLVVQDDGFPLHDRLSDFIGRYDFVGAPYVRRAWWREAICGMLGTWVSNGGFSLRSRNICKAAALYWRQKWQARHPCEATVDDLYYTRTLPLRHLLYRFRFRIANVHVALGFSYDDAVNQPLDRVPMGFHRASTFETLQKHNIITAMNYNQERLVG